MLTDLEMKILHTLSSQLLMRNTEIAKNVNMGIDGVSVSVQRLREMGYVDKVESLGMCYVITQKGLRVIKENNGSL